jgi:hypothetical protein
VARCTEKESFFEQLLCGVLCTDRVVRAETAEFDCVAEMLVGLAADLDEAAQCPLGIRRSRVEQDAIAGVSGIDSLTNRRRRVAAFQGNLRDEQVRERVEHHVWSPDELRLRTWVLLLPQLEALRKFDLPLRDFTPLTPGVNLFRFEGYEDAFAAVFHGGNPADLISQRSAIHANGEFTVDVIGCGLEAREANQ